MCRRQESAELYRGARSEDHAREELRELEAGEYGDRLAGTQHGARIARNYVIIALHSVTLWGPFNVGMLCGDPGCPAQIDIVVDQRDHRIEPQ